MSFDPVHVRARFDGRAFVPETPVDLPPGALLEGWAATEEKSLPKPLFGSARGLVWMSDDFDAPIEDFAEYM